MTQENDKSKDIDQIKTLDIEIKQLMKKRKELANNTPKEQVDSKKFAHGMGNFWSPVLWLKDIASIINIRKIIIYALVVGSIYGYGYIKGVRGKPVHFNLEGKEATIALNKHFLKIEKDGTAKVVDESGKVLKTIKTKDIPELQKALKPIGVDIRPFFTTGIGVGNKKIQHESGIGLSLFKFYKIHMDTWLTNYGIYLGSDYQLTDNFGLLGGAGKGFNGDSRIYFGGKWRF